MCFRRPGAVSTERKSNVWCASIVRHHVTFDQRHDNHLCDRRGQQRWLDQWAKNRRIWTAISALSSFKAKCPVL